MPKNALRALGALVAVAVAAAIGVAVRADATTSVAIEATVADIQRPSVIRTFQTIDYGKTAETTDDRVGKTKWRVINDTGNCCENYVTTTKSGRLYDFGGTYVNYTDDRGLTWKQVRPLTPLVNGEGTISVAPNGDIIGIGWDPYSGDHLQAFKFNATDGRWYYNELPLHTPFYDREWVTVVPGPFVIDGETYPYLSFLKGGWPSKELWLYSTDGLNYLEVSSKWADRTQNGTRQTWLKPKLRISHAWAFDWIQPNSNSGLTAFGNGIALASGDTFTGWSILDQDTEEWYSFRFPDGTQPSGRYQVDSKQRVHNVVSRGSSFDYRWSDDGGQTWVTRNFALPAGMAIEQWDFRAHGSIGVAAVAMRVQKAGGNDQDLLFKVDLKQAAPHVLRLYTVGKGDLGAAAGVGQANAPRFDFETVAILPDGRVAMAMHDSTTTNISPTTGQPRSAPALAVETDSTFK